MACNGITYPPTSHVSEQQQKTPQRQKYAALRGFLVNVMLLLDSVCHCVHHLSQADAPGACSILQTLTGLRLDPHRHTDAAVLLGLAACAGSRSSSAHKSRQKSNCSLKSRGIINGSPSEPLELIRTPSTLIFSRSVNQMELPTSLPPSSAARLTPSSLVLLK